MSRDAQVIYGRGCQYSSELSPEHDRFIENIYEEIDCLDDRLIGNNAFFTDVGGVRMWRRLITTLDAKL
jgi:hypothetical protein